MKSVTIANASGYWGDDPFALKRQLSGSKHLDYICMDFLAEVSMSILEKQRSRDSKKGYAEDFIFQVAPQLEKLIDSKVCLITNAGGVNPRGCAEVLMSIAGEQKLDLKIAVVEGDGILSKIPGFLKAGAEMCHLESGESIESIYSDVRAANVYFGSEPLVSALREKVDILICGRATDTSLTVAPLMYEFSWKSKDYSKIAAAVVAGHILECGAQASGGNFTDWRKVSSFENMGFPIVEFFEDGTFIVTKHNEQGGLVSEQTVKEQLLYESSDPLNYIVPDAIVDFSSIRLQEVESNKVKVSGVLGRAPTNFLKVSAAYKKGYRCSGSILISGPEAIAKAKVFEAILWTKFDEALDQLELLKVDDRCSERIGASRRDDIEVSEILLRFSARSESRESLEVLRKLIPSLILSGPPGAAVTGGAPRVSEEIAYFPSLFPIDQVEFGISVFDDNKDCTLQRVVAKDMICTQHGGELAPYVAYISQQTFSNKTQDVRLIDIAHARSGDKGSSVNIGLIGRSELCFEWLCQNITDDFIKGYFTEFSTEVIRYELPNLWALNFILTDVLQGGGTSNLRLDAQGKTLGQLVLEASVSVPVEVLETISKANSR